MILTEKHQLIRKLCRDFAEKELTSDILDEVEATNTFPQEIQDKMAKAGFFSIKVPKEYGGGGCDTLSYIIMVEEFARVSPVSSLYVNAPNSLGGGPLVLSATEYQIEKYLKPVGRGEIKMAFGLTEPVSGTDAASMTTTAVKDGDDYILNGRKCFITMAPLADYAIIYAKTDPKKGNKGITAFIIDMKQPGVSTGKPEKKMGLIGCATSDIIMEDVRVKPENILGEVDRGFINAMKTLDGGRLGVSAQSLGVAQACLEEAIKFAKERKSFGRPLTKFQAISFMIAEMGTKLAAARELVYAAAQKKDAGDKDASMYCSMAKFFASETCNEIAAKAVQIHGGYGFMKDYKVERMYRDCRIFTIYEGTSQVQEMVISGSLLK